MGDKGKDAKIVKAYCPKSKHHYGLMLQKAGTKWEVENVIDLTETEANIITPEVPVSQLDGLTTNANLLPCSLCGSRKVRGCSCEKTRWSCEEGSDYNFGCIYCKDLVFDEKLPTKEDLDSAGVKEGEGLCIGQGKEIKAVTFSNVNWEPFDEIRKHADGSKYDEPRIHVVANEKNIEFHGYNVSEMNEGVYYTIGRGDDFTIECDVDATQITPHPGGYFYVDFGLIQAQVRKSGGAFMLDGKKVASVGAHFTMKLSVKNGKEYSVVINGVERGTVSKRFPSGVKIRFGFTHTKHNCEKLSHAYVKNINMTQGVSRK